MSHTRHPALFQSEANGRVSVLSPHLPRTLQNQVGLGTGLCETRRDELLLHEQHYPGGTFNPAGPVRSQGTHAIPLPGPWSVPSSDSVCFSLQIKWQCRGEGGSLSGMGLGRRRAPRRPHENLAVGSPKLPPTERVMRRLPPTSHSGGRVGGGLFKKLQ